MGVEGGIKGFESIHFRSTQHEYTGRLNYQEVYNPSVLFEQYLLFN